LTCCRCRTPSAAMYTRLPPLTTCLIDEHAATRGRSATEGGDEQVGVKGAYQLCAFQPREADRTAGTFDPLAAPRSVGDATPPAGLDGRCGSALGCLAGAWQPQFVAPTIISRFFDPRKQGQGGTEEPNATRNAEPLLDPLWSHDARGSALHRALRRRAPTVSQRRWLGRWD
jgi:hypothetical protein